MTTTCYACGKELEPVYNPDTEYQFENALWVTFSGSYSMFVDYIGDPELVGYKCVICHDCAHLLCAAVPWAQRLIKPQASHAHTEEYWQANPEHEGWDKAYWEKKGETDGSHEEETRET